MYVALMRALPFAESLVTSSGMHACRRWCGRSGEVAKALRVGIAREEIEARESSTQIPSITITPSSTASSQLLRATRVSFED